MSTATLLRYQPTFTDRRRSSSGSSNSSTDSTPGRLSPTSTLQRNTLQYQQCLINDKQGEIGRLNTMINNLAADQQCYRQQLVDWYTTAENELNVLKEKLAALQGETATQEATKEVAAQ